MRVDGFRAVFSDGDRAEIARRVDAVLRSGSLTLGPQTLEFEEEFAARHGATFGIATSSGSSALETIFRSLDVSGKEVVLPSNTFFATAAAVVHAGGRVRFADVDPRTLALDPTTLDAAATRETVGVVHVHIGGAVSPDTAAIAAMCEARGWWLVEDAAHAHGSSYAQRSAGTFGVASAFSFYPTKVITSGEGGMVLTSSAQIRDDVRRYRDQGKAAFDGGEHVVMGSAWRMSEIHAAIGVVHLRSLDGFMTNRSEVAAIYTEALRSMADIEPLALDGHSRSNHYKYVAFLEPGVDRASFKQSLAEQHDIHLPGEVYARPLHRQPVFASTDPPALPVTDDVCARHVCLPIHSDMEQREVRAVLDAICTVLTDGE